MLTDRTAIIDRYRCHPYKRGRGVLIFIYNISFFIFFIIYIFWTDTPEQTAKTKIRLLLDELSDEGLHCLACL